MRRAPRTTIAFLLGASVLGASALAAGAAAGRGFSIDAASPSESGGSNSAILAPGPVGGPPEVAVAPAALGLAGGAADEIDAMSSGMGAAGATFHFSVSRASVGLAGDVVAEAAAGQAAGDLFASALDGSNVLVRNQHGFGLVPAAPAGTPSPAPVDDVDAFDFSNDLAAGLMAHALAPGHPRMGTAVGCGGDVFLADALFVGYPTLGLGSCLDDVDALEFVSSSLTFYFSLAPGSPSLAPGSPIAGCAAGCSPADLFSFQFGAPSATLFATAASLGLQPTDDVDALALAEAHSVPALGGAGAILLAVLLVGAAALRRAA